MLENARWFEELCERLKLEAEEVAVEEYRQYMRAHWQRVLDRG